MRNRIAFGAFVFCVVALLSSCSNSSLEKENEELQKQVEAQQAQIDKLNGESTAQEDDVTVFFAGKATLDDDITNSAYFSFDVTNNTDKPIKGIEGVATFNDMFDKEIMTMQCDLTGQTIQPGETAKFDQLSYSCNQYIDEEAKLYNTDYFDMKLVYQVKTIVFEDGSSKKIEQ